MRLGKEFVVLKRIARVVCSMVALEACQRRGCSSVRSGFENGQGARVTEGGIDGSGIAAV